MALQRLRAQQAIRSHQSGFQNISTKADNFVTDSGLQAPTHLLQFHMPRHQRDASLPLGTCKPIYRMPLCSDHNWLHY